MNLNEECLLQFLQSEQPGPLPGTGFQHEGTLTHDLKRILRRSRYVSFPPAILIRRPHLPRGNG